MALRCFQHKKDTISLLNLTVMNNSNSIWRLQLGRLEFIRHRQCPDSAVNWLHCAESPEMEPGDLHNSWLIELKLENQSQIISKAAERFLPAIIEDTLDKHSCFCFFFSNTSLNLQCYLSLPTDTETLYSTDETFDYSGLSTIYGCILWL